MKIIVCIKQVPAKDAPLAIAGNWIKESDIGFEMNEPDSYALEEALRLKEKHGGEVIALSLGPERVKQTIKEALAKGAGPLVDGCGGMVQDTALSFVRVSGLEAEIMVGIGPVDADESGEWLVR